MKGNYAEIDLNIIGNNVKEILKKYNNYEYYIGVVKSDAYGHGEYIVNELINNGINYLAVSYIEEALEIRKYNKKISILCLQPIDLDDINIVLENNITIIVHDIDYLKKLINLKLNKKLNVHIKIDSGMSRLGLKNKEEVKEAYEMINQNENMFLEGIYSHFATIGVFDNKWDNQLKNFKEITSLIDINTIPIRHLGSSITLLSHPKIDFCNAVRMGTIIYGYNVGPKSSNMGLKNKLRNIRNLYYKKKYNISDTYTNVELDIKPCMSLYTSILQIKKINKGDYVGYGASYKAESDMLIAIIPVGYNEGIGRDNNNRYVYINENKYEVIGALGMNMLCIRIDDKVKLDDKVMLMGDKISLGQMARFADRSIHEMLLNIGKSNKKVYIKNNKIEFIKEK